MNGAGASPWTAEASATTAALATPTGFTAVQELAGAGNIVIRLTWTDVAADETGYELQRSTDQSTWGAAVALPAGAASYIDAGGAYMTTSYYRVRAVSAGGNSAWATASVYNGAVAVPVYWCPPPPAAPSAAVLSDTSVRVTWVWPASCYEVAIERAPSASGPWSEVTRRVGDLTRSSTRFWDDTGLTPGTAYSYRVRTIAPSAAWSSSGYTAAVTVTTTGSQAPSAPSGLAATVTSGHHRDAHLDRRVHHRGGLRRRVRHRGGGPVQRGLPRRRRHHPGPRDGHGAGHRLLVPRQAYQGTALSAPPTWRPSPPRRAGSSG